MPISNSSASQSLSVRNSHTPNCGDVLFPRCGLTYNDLVSTAEKCRTKKECAARLGVSDNQLDRVIKKHDLHHLFSKQAGELFAGVTAADLLKAACRCANMSEAAQSLGVSQSYFTKKVKEIGATDYFKRRKPRKRRITKRSTVQLARQGYTRRDAAFLLGVSPAYLKDVVNIWGIADEFIVKGLGKY
jgi:predicted DNA-binding transcriptional regulator AlpA